jgi:xylan 1,4-beta-xylosidase
MRPIFAVLIILLALTSCQTQPLQKTTADDVQTYCNPVNISYRFMPEEPSRREAADPTVLWFKDRYFLFASKSGGYWHSKDLASWSFVETSQIPVEEYAPTAIVLNDTVYFLASSTEKSTIYKSSDPLSGQWQVAVEELEMPVWDPAFLNDDNGRVYLYWGCSNEKPIYGVEVDYRNGFAFIGEPLELIHQNPSEHGWEVPGDYNTLVNQKPWIEGAWMTKKDGTYYLQYSGPGTEYKSYADGLYISENPLGPFELQEHNPVFYKPEGFAAGAGHGSSFTDEYGNGWHIGTITISQKHMFERRLGLYPVFYDAGGTMYSTTRYGDYPLLIPQQKVNGFDDIFPGWMLLSYDKNVEVSSAIDSLPPANMTDEDIRTYWAAESGGADEYAILDMGDEYDVYAVQINFAEHNTEIYGRQPNLHHRYLLKYSVDGNTWELLANKSESTADNTHDYIQLDNSAACRYIKITNVEVPGGHFALSGLRVFGKGKGEKPGKVNSFTAERNPADKRSVLLNWEKVEGATGYNISFGTDSNKLYHNYMVYADTSVTINSLHAGKDYFFSIEAFNENGITTNEAVISAK